MSIILCEGNCQKCDAKVDCPYKNDEKFQQNLIHNKWLDLAREHVLNPESLMDLMEGEGYSLFNIMNAWGDNCNITRDNIKNEIISWLPEDFKNSISADLDVIFLESISNIAITIYGALNNNCAKKCYSCFLEESCPKAQKIKI